MKLLLFFGLIVVVKLLINAWKLFEIKKLRKLYFEWLDKGGPQFVERIPVVKKLFESSGLAKVSIPAIQPVGGGFVAQGTASVVDNLNNRREDFVSTILSIFDRAVGVFRMRMIESVSPIFWIESIVFLPKNLVSYVGGKKDGVISKSLQVLYWIATPLLIVFRTNTYDFILKLLEQMK